MLFSALIDQAEYLNYHYELATFYLSKKNCVAIAKVYL